MAKITVQNTEITVLSHNDKDYISLTDMANGKQSESRWEMIHNPNFKVVEFDHFRIQAGLPSFVMSVSECQPVSARALLACFQRDARMAHCRGKGNAFI